MSTRKSLVLGAPGEAEMPLLADLGARDDVEVLAIVDPDGDCLGSSIAEIMGLPVLRSLDELSLANGDRPEVVLPASPPAVAATILRMAEARGLPTTRPDQLRNELTAPRTTPQPAPPPTPSGAHTPDLETIDRESRALQASLADLEDALAGDTIMRRLLALCTRAVGASGGSVMLFDDTSRELYIAYATGLSEGTLHSTRVKLGEGISGRVALSRKAELVEGQHGPEIRHRDRPNIATAVCTPLHAEGQLLGVLSVSTQMGEPALTHESRDALAGLAERLSRILHEVLQLQQQRTTRMFHLTEQQLRRLAGDIADLPNMLVAWTGALALTTEADLVTLAIPCEDGGLLVAESTPENDGKHWHEALRNPAWIEVLGSGAPLVARQTVAEDGASEAVTVFYLPVGRQPVKAGLAVHFHGPSRAHAFHALAGETVFLLDRLLPDLLTQRRQSQRAEMLSRLSRAMSELTGHESTPGALLERLCEATRELTGARYAVAVAELGEDLPRLAGGNAPDQAPWLRDLGRLLEAAIPDGWRITTLETPDHPLSVMALPSPGGQVTPGLVLLGKDRTHELDGCVFTLLDAELVLPLASSLPRLMPRPATPPTPVPTPAPEPTAPEPPPPDEDEKLELTDILSAAPESDEKLVVEEGLIIDPAPIVESLEHIPSGALVTVSEEAEEQLIADLAREMDRCDRYHNVCGLVILKVELPVEAAYDLLTIAARRLAERLRISDRVYVLPGRELVTMVPEDVRNLAHLQERLTADVRSLAGNAELTVLGGRAAYPTVRGPAPAFLATIRKRLRD